MAHQTTEEQIIATLATSLTEILKIHEATISSSKVGSSSSSSSNSRGTRLQSSCSSIIGSAQLSLIQFTLAVQLESFNDNKAHVILHVDGNSASASPASCEDASKNMPLEVVQLGLISDKFPVDGIPPRGLSKDAKFLVKFWADLNFDDACFQIPASFYVTSIFESAKMMKISCKTSVCSFGRSIGDKVERLPGTQLAPNRVIYQSVRAPLCDYLVNFIHKLKDCEQVGTMNGVLENFSILQVISDDVTGEMLLCFVYVFEVCPPELSATTGAMCKVYRLEGSSVNNNANVPSC